jgi:hypothetical protein
MRGHPRVAELCGLHGDGRQPPHERVREIMRGKSLDDSIRRPPHKIRRMV